jgi:hypothetical protein
MIFSFFRCSNELPARSGLLLDIEPRGHCAAGRITLGAGGRGDNFGFISLRLFHFPIPVTLTLRHFLYLLYQLSQLDLTIRSMPLHSRQSKKYREAGNGGSSGHDNNRVIQDLHVVEPSEENHAYRKQ